MIIPIHPHGNQNETPEWAMVELQGEIVRKDGDPNTGGYDVGSFSRSKTVRNFSNERVVLHPDRSHECILSCREGWY